MPESPEHHNLKKLLENKMKEWFGASISEYPSAGHDLDVFAITPSKVSIYIEIIWSHSKAQFLSDINMLQQSDANIKLVVASKEILVNRYMVREFTNTVIAQRKEGKVIHYEMLDGLRILNDNKYVDETLRTLILNMMEQVKLNKDSDVIIPLTVTKRRSNHLVEVYSPLIHIDFKDMFSYHLPNIQTLIEYLLNIPIQIRNTSNEVCLVNRIYLQRSMGLLSIFKAVKSLLDQSSEIETVALETVEILPLRIKPGDTITIRVPTNSVLDINRIVEGNDVYIVVENSYGIINKSKKFSSINFWIYGNAVRVELEKQVSRILLREAVTEKYEPKKFVGYALELANKMGFFWMSFLGFLLEVAEKERASLGISQELINEIRNEHNKMTSFMKDIAITTINKLQQKNAQKE